MTIIIPNKNEPNIEIMANAVRKLFPEAQLILSDDLEGVGKGWAIREGLKRADSLPVIFIDGDLDIKPLEISRVLAFSPRYFGFDVVVGKKEMPQNWKRRLITRLSRRYIRFMFGLKVDTQTGLKLFYYKPDFKTNGWACDIEMLYKAKKMGKKIHEVPIHATVSDSKTLKDLWTTFVDSLKIRFSL